MANDLTNLTIPAQFNEVISRIDETGYFSDNLTILRFAFSYAIKHYFEEFDPEEIDTNYAGGNSALNYNVGSIDGGDKFLYNFILSAYPECETPYKYIRGVIIYGLKKLNEKLKDLNTISYDDIITK